MPLEFKITPDKLGGYETFKGPDKALVSYFSENVFKILTGSAAIQAKDADLGIKDLNEFITCYGRKTSTFIAITQNSLLHFLTQLIPFRLNRIDGSIKQFTQEDFLQPKAGSVAQVESSINSEEMEEEEDIFTGELIKKPKSKKTSPKVEISPITNLNIEEFSHGLKKLNELFSFIENDKSVTFEICFQIWSHFVYAAIQQIKKNGACVFEKEIDEYFFRLINKKISATSLSKSDETILNNFVGDQVAWSNSATIAMLSARIVKFLASLVDEKSALYEADLSQKNDSATSLSGIPAIPPPPPGPLPGMLPPPPPPPPSKALSIGKTEVAARKFPVIKMHNESGIKLILAMTELKYVLLELKRLVVSPSLRLRYKLQLYYLGFKLHFFIQKTFSCLESKVFVPNYLSTNDLITALEVVILEDARKPNREIPGKEMRKYWAVPALLYKQDEPTSIWKCIIASLLKEEISQIASKDEKEIFKLLFGDRYENELLQDTTISYLRVIMLIFAYTMLKHIALCRKKMLMSPFRNEFLAKIQAIVRTNSASGLGLNNESDIENFLSIGRLLELGETERVQGAIFSLKNDSLAEFYRIFNQSIQEDKDRNLEDFADLKSWEEAYNSELLPLYDRCLKRLATPQTLLQNTLKIIFIAKYNAIIPSEESIFTQTASCEVSGLVQRDFEELLSALESTPTSSPFHNELRMAVVRLYCEYLKGQKDISLAQYARVVCKSPEMGVNLIKLIEEQKLADIKRNLNTIDMETVFCMMVAANQLLFTYLDRSQQARKISKGMRVPVFDFKLGIEDTLHVDEARLRSIAMSASAELSVNDEKQDGETKISRLFEERIEKFDLLLFNEILSIDHFNLGRKASFLYVDFICFFLNKLTKKPELFLKLTDINDFYKLQQLILQLFALYKNLAERLRRQYQEMPADFFWINAEIYGERTGKIISAEGIKAIKIVVDSISIKITPAIKNVIHGDYKIIREFIESYHGEEKISVIDFLKDKIEVLVESCHFDSFSELLEFIRVLAEVGLIKHIEQIKNKIPFQLTLEQYLSLYDIFSVFFSEENEKELSEIRQFTCHLLPKLAANKENYLSLIAYINKEEDPARLRQLVEVFLNTTSKFAESGALKFNSFEEFIEFKNFCIKIIGAIGGKTTLSTEIIKEFSNFFNYHDNWLAFSESSAEKRQNVADEIESLVGEIFETFSTGYRKKIIDKLRNLPPVTEASTEQVVMREVEKSIYGNNETISERLEGERQRQRQKREEEVKVEDVEVNIETETSEEVGFKADALIRTAESSRSIIPTFVPLKQGAAESPRCETVSNVSPSDKLSAPFNEEKEIPILPLQTFVSPRLQPAESPRETQGIANVTLKQPSESKAGGSNHPVILVSTATSPISSELQMHEELPQLQLNTTFSEEDLSEKTENEASAYLSVTDVQGDSYRTGGVSTSGVRRASAAVHAKREVTSTRPRSSSFSSIFIPASQLRMKLSEIMRKKREVSTSELVEVFAKVDQDDEFTKNDKNYYLKYLMQLFREILLSSIPEGGSLKTLKSTHLFISDIRTTQDLAKEITNLITFLSTERKERIKEGAKYFALFNLLCEIRPTLDGILKLTLTKRT